MGVDLTLAELRSRLNRLGSGAILRISESDYERLFGINEVAAAAVAEFAKRYHCVSIPGADALYFRKWDANRHHSTELAQDDSTMSC